VNKIKAVYGEKKEKDVEVKFPYYVKIENVESGERTLTQVQKDSFVQISRMYDEGGVVYQAVIINGKFWDLTDGEEPIVACLDELIGAGNFKCTEEEFLDFVAEMKLVVSKKVGDE
jgi:hypothetical protein